MTIAVVVPLQFDGERGVVGHPVTWVQVAVVGAKHKIVAEVVGVACGLGAVLLRTLAAAAAVRDRVLLAALPGGPVAAAAAQRHGRSGSHQQQDGTDARQHIVPVGRDGLHRHCVYCGLHPRHGNPWRVGGHITGWHHN